MAELFERLAHESNEQEVAGLESAMAQVLGHLTQFGAAELHEGMNDPVRALG